MIPSLFATSNDLTVSVLTLILRLVLGLVILPHGAQKLLGWFGGYDFKCKFLFDRAFMIMIYSS